MAKNAGDVILRDRMQFEIPADGNLSTLYGRIDLSDYVNTVERKGLSVKEVRFHLRDPNNVSLNAVKTGILSPAFRYLNASETAGKLSAIKLFATTRAYENAKDVGIASPDVICVEEYLQVIPPSEVPPNRVTNYEFMLNRYGTPDLHPSGFTVVSDLLIGIATDALYEYSDGTLEVDVMIIAAPVSVSTARMNEILTQAQDL